MKKILFVFLLMLSCFEMAISAENKSEDAKSLSGISIVGNKETPKSLFIVPWKSSEIGFETGLSSSLLNEKMVPVDKDVFERELNFYAITQD